MMSMNPMIAHTLPYATIVLVATLVAIFLFEGKGDERDMMHRASTDRYVLFVVMLLLAAGVFIDQLHETFNPWMVGALCAAIVVKTISRVAMYFKD
jgi:Mg2+/citrate symporter